MTEDNILLTVNISHFTNGVNKEQRLPRLPLSSDVSCCITVKTCL